jgi:biopolymer transport protein ExbD
MTARTVSHIPVSVSLDLTPLVDCIFLLIVFFIVAGKIPRAEFHESSELPNDMRIGGLVPVVCYIVCLQPEKSGDVHWTVDSTLARSRSELVAQVASQVASSSVPLKVASIEAGPFVEFYAVVTALDACHCAGVEKVVFSPPRLPLSQWSQPFPKNIPLLQFPAK